MDKTEAAKALKEALPPRQYMDGETFWYLGNHNPLRIVPDQSLPSLWTKHSS